MVVFAYFGNLSFEQEPKEEIEAEAEETWYSTFLWTARDFAIMNCSKLAVIILFILSIT